MSNSLNGGNSTFTFEPPTGGDITLRSKDGSIFTVYSIILSLVSSVFSDMLSFGEQSKEIIELDDDAESISMILAFIYPSGIWPTITNIDKLEKCLQIANKYDIQKVPQALDRDLALNSGLICHDPVRIFHLAVTYGLRNCQAIAAKSITSLHIDLRKPLEVVKVAKDYPSAAHVIGLVGAQTIRVNLLASILFEYNSLFLPRTHVASTSRQETGFTDIDGAELMMCDGCASRTTVFWATTRRPIEYAPSWVYAWSQHAYKFLGSRSLEQCEHVFELESLIGLESSPGVCEDCIQAARDACAELGGRPGNVFESWAADVKRLIEEKLKELDPLYLL